MFLQCKRPTSLAVLTVFTLREQKKRDRAEKYANDFKEGEILLIPELVEAVEPKTLSFVVTDLKTKRLAGLKKETFEDLLKSANIQVSTFAAEALLPGRK